MATPRVQVDINILDKLVPPYIRMSDQVKSRFIELIQEEMNTVLELSTELDENMIRVNELRYVLSLRGINICF
jgi:hypothetical protein